MLETLSILRSRSLSRVLVVIAFAGVINGCKKSEEDDAAAKPGATCGKKPLPDCPLQKWMKENLKPALEQKDGERLAKGLENVASHAPGGFSTWSEIATAGAEAARKGDITEVKAKCKTCHDEHRSRFREEIREKPLF